MTHQRKPSKIVKQCHTFEDLYQQKIICPGIYEYAREFNYIRLSPVQEAVIPMLITQHCDVAVEACTGSGKTLTFLIPCVEILQRKSNTCTETYEGVCVVGAVCLAPTRELVVQISLVLQNILKYVQSVNYLAFTGGSDVRYDLASIQRARASDGCHMTIVLATPGRLNRLLQTAKQNRDWILSELDMLIFDEADRMFVDHSSFSAQLSEIQSILPKQRKTALFSATLTSEMTSLIKSGMRNPVFIKVSFNSSDETPSSTTTHALPTTLQTFYVHVPRQYKFALLFQFLLSPLCRRDTPTKCIVFCATCGSVNFIYKCFARLKPFFPYIHAERLYGKMNQKLRIQTYKRFISSEHSCSVLFATDLAARGLDFPCVHWILQFDAPTNPSMFVHRIGRTARAGHHGNSLLFVTSPELASIPFFQHRLIPLMPLNSKTAQSTVYTESIRNVNLTSLLHECICNLCKDIPQHLQKGCEECTKEQLLIESAQSDEYIDCVSLDNFYASWVFFRSLILYSREYLKLATHCFVSLIRSYKEHSLQYIYPFQEFEIGELGTSLGLLRLPRVKEILGKTIKHFIQSQLDPNHIRFQDPEAQKVWEKLRETTVKKEKKPNQLVKKKERTRPEKRQVKKRQAEQEWNDLALEERLTKKLRKRKITFQDYQRLLSHNSSELFDDSIGHDSNRRLNVVSTLKWIKRGKKKHKK